LTAKNTHGHTLDRLGARIVAGHYPSGTSVPPEPLLCAEFGVSRTVIREAVKSLVAKGLLITGPKLGTRVLPSAMWNWFDPDVVGWQSRAGLSHEFLRDLQELRRVVEPAAIEAAYAGMKDAIEHGGDYVLHDLLFHQGLLRACHNRMVVQMSKALGALLRTSFEISTRRLDGPTQSLPMHRAVLDAVIARDPPRAERAILLLIDNAREDIDQVLASRAKLPSLVAPASMKRRSRWTKASLRQCCRRCGPAAGCNCA
jgi:DNA-binding FadR family transcriptional regulator